MWTLGGRRKSGDLEGKSEVLQAMDEPVNVPALTPFVEVIGTEVFIEGSARQHFIGGGRDRSGDGANGFPGTAAGAQAMELRLEVTGLLAGGGRSALDQVGLEPGGAPRFREGRLLRIRVEPCLPREPAILEA